MQMALSDITDLLADQPSLTAAVAASLPRFGDALAAAEDAGSGTLQYPALLTDLGALDVLADDPETAEPMLRHSLTLVPHQPAAHIWLELAVTAQGHDATSEADMAVAEAHDMLWQSSGSLVAPDIAEQMTAVIDRYVARFPDREDSVADLRTMLTQSAASP
jgi:hypothetical protein